MVNSWLWDKEMPLTKSNEEKDLEKSCCINGLSHEFCLDHNRGELICINCGLVFEEKIMSVEEGNCLSIIKDAKRDTFKSAYQKSKIYHNTASNLLLRAENPLLYRALRFELKIAWSERKIQIGIVEIKKIGANLSLQKIVIESAIRLFQKAIQRPEFKGRYVMLIARVCLLYELRKANYPIDLKTLFEDQIFSIRLGLSFFYTLIQVLSLRRPRFNPQEFVIRICSSFGLPQSVVSLSCSIVSLYFQKTNCSGKNPKGIVAAAIYLTAIMCGRPVSQNKIANAANLTDLTLRNHLKYMQILIKKYRFNLGL